MKRMSLRKFGEIVAQVVESLPNQWRPYLDNVVVDVDEEPDEETLREQGFTDAEIADGETLLGLFVPLPMPRGDLEFTDVPHRIIIYKRPHEEIFTDRHELMAEIRKTVIHELAHHFGLTEREVGELGLE